MKDKNKIIQSLSSKGEKEKSSAKSSDNIELKSSKQLTCNIDIYPRTFKPISSFQDSTKQSPTDMEDNLLNLLQENIEGVLFFEKDENIKESTAYQVINKILGTKKPIVKIIKKKNNAGS